MSSEAECKDDTLVAFKKSGDFNKMMNKWDKKPSLDQNWTNFKTFIANKYAKFKAKCVECSAGTAGFGHQVNMAKEQPGIEDYISATGNAFTTIAQSTKKRSKQ